MNGTGTTAMIASTANRHARQALRDLLQRTPEQWQQAMATIQDAKLRAYVGSVIWWDLQVPSLYDYVFAVDREWTPDPAAMEGALIAVGYSPDFAQSRAKPPKGQRGDARRMREMRKNNGGEGRAASARTSPPHGSAESQS